MEFARETFGAISPNAISLIQDLTKTDPSERLSCAAALTHSWLTEGAKQTAISLHPPLLTPSRTFSHLLTPSHTFSHIFSHMFPHLLAGAPPRSPTPG